MTRSNQASSPIATQAVKVWDLPLRLFHWLLVGLVITLWYTGETGEMLWHERCAYALLTLVLFRLLWGVLGSDTARFSQFVRGPAAVLAYLRESDSTTAQPTLGHNPLGAWSVLALLGLLLLQVGTGLFANDDIATEGPWFAWVSYAQSNWLTYLHKVNFQGLLALISLHVSAIIFYRLHQQENLVQPMLTGYKHLPADLNVTPPRLAPGWLALLLLLVAAAGVYVLLALPQWLG